jgi:hypothetical protein
LAKTLIRKARYVMKKKLARKLTLNRETLRKLEGAELGKVKGAAPPDTDETCFHTCLNSCGCK